MPWAYPFQSYLLSESYGPEKEYCKWLKRAYIWFYARELKNLDKMEILLGKYKHKCQV